MAVWRVFLKLDNRDAATRLLPVRSIQFPRTEHCIEIKLIPSNEEHVEIGFEIRQQITMREVVWILPNLVSLALRQALQPRIFLVVLLNDLRILRHAHRARTYTGVG